MNQLQDLYEYLNKASMSGMSERSANHVSAAIAIVKQMMQEEPVAFFDKYGEVFNEVEKLLPTDTPLYAAPQAVPAWLPIESAPKDMFAYLFLCDGVALQGFMDATGVMCVCQEKGANRWRLMRRKPTHWMPLPAAPKGAV